MDSGSSVGLENESNYGFVLPALCFIGLASCFLYRNTFGYWTRMGVKGPTPWPIVGNLITQLMKPRWDLEVEWREKYGKCYGTYRGGSPRLHVADPEVLLQVCIKDFDHFPNHDMGEFGNKFQKTFLFFLQDDQWRKIRALMSPTFTSGKIKRMFKLIDNCSDDLVECFREQLQPTGHAGEPSSALINAKDLYYLFTMDTISTCCYGIKMERVKNAKDLNAVATRNHFVEIAMQIFRFSKWRMFAMIAVPKFILRFFDFKFVPDESFKSLAETSAQLIEKRRKSGKKMDDYLQLLIDAKLDDELELNDMDLEENHHAGLTHESLIEDQKKMISAIGKSSANSSVVMSDFEILGSAMFLLAVGLETTGMLLSHCTYALAFHQEIQQRLYEELMKIVERQEDKSKVYFNYDSLTSCRYLDAVLSETLRRMSPLPVMNRKTTRDYVLEKYNILLKKGSPFDLCYHAIHMDPDYWPQPELFDPERFMPGNKEKIVPGSYCPFGIGPRHCIGMRFSLTEAKLGLAKIVMNFKFEPAPNTRFPPDLKISIGFAELKNPTVKLVPRN